MKLNCPGTEHDVDLAQRNVSYLCAGCRVDEQRVWMRSKHAKTVAERKRKRKVWNEVLRQYEPTSDRPPRKA